ncbi:SEC14-like protein 2 isoform X2 [Folsomia candida]|nr:SEC14-like protein 2 isoform X2 [Folsomia candida]
MKKDIYLVRWLRARNFNIHDAELMLINNLEWRKENGIDTILDEDWSDFEKDFPFDIQGCDKEGRPVITVPVGDWDIRKAVLAGKQKRTMRYFDKLFEEITTYIRISQEKGENVKQYDLIVEMSNYNLINQGCAMCIPIYHHFLQTYANYYPGTGHSTTLVNVPNIFLTLWEILIPFRSSRDEFHMYGKNTIEWQAALLKFIDKAQLTKAFGGVRNEPYTSDELKGDGGHFKCPKYVNMSYFFCN